MKKYLALFFVAFFYSGLTQAALFINVVEDGSNVVATSSGSVDLTGLSGSTGNNGYDIGGRVTGGGTDTIVFGTSALKYRFYSIPSAGSFMPSSADAFTQISVSGDYVGMLSGTSGGVVVPDGYVSNTSLSGTATWSNKSISTLGMTPGTYVSTLGNGDTVTLSIGSIGSDTTNPTLTSSTPADNATGVAVTAPTINFTFDEPVFAQSGLITVHRTSDNSQVNNRSVTGATGDGTPNISITFENALSADTEYYVLVPATAFDDAAGNSYAGLASTTALSFTTAAGADTTNPTLQSSTPADNATGVAVDTNIVLIFDEPVDTETGTITIKLTSDDSTVETIDVTSGLVTGTGTATITVNPAGDLTEGTEYYVLIDATAFDDGAGNSYAGLASTTALSFTTTAGAGNGPILQSSTPEDNATGVAVDANIVLTFDGPVDTETGTITIKKTSDGTTVAAIDVTSSLVTGTGTATITVNPEDDLTAGTEYYVLIDATAFDDAATNSYAGLASTTALSFTTVGGALPNPFDDERVVGLIQAQTQTAARVATQAIGTVSGRLSQLIFNSSDNSTANNSYQGVKFVTDVDSNLDSALSQSGLLSGLNSSGDIFHNGWAVWTEGAVVLGKSDGKSDFHIDRIAIGADKRITPSFTAGLALQAIYEDNDVGSASTIDTDAYSATAYGSYVLNDKSYIQGALGYSDIDFSTKRTDDIGTFGGERDADQVYMLLSFTRQFEHQDLTLLPYGSFSGSYSTLDTYSETGTGAALTYHEQDVKTLAATIGLRGKYFIQQSHGSFVPRFHINYQGDIDSDGDAKVSYVSVPSTTFSSSFDAISSSSWLFGLGIDYQYKSLNVSADYERTEEISWGYSNTYKLNFSTTF